MEGLTVTAQHQYMVSSLKNIVISKSSSNVHQEDNSQLWIVLYSSEIIIHLIALSSVALPVDTHQQARRCNDVCKFTGRWVGLDKVPCSQWQFHLIWSFRTATMMALTSRECFFPSTVISLAMHSHNLAHINNQLRRFHQYNFSFQSEELVSKHIVITRQSELSTYYHIY